MTKRIVAAFDFDGTITRRDTLLPFLKKYGSMKLAKATLETIVRVRYHGLRDDLKENILRELFSGFPTEQFEMDGKNYSATLPILYRKEIVERINSHSRKGHELILVTASLGCYARPAAKALGFDHTIAVELTSRSGRLTGEMTGLNVRGPEKARLLRSYLGYEEIDLWAYGNSSGDREMLLMANHATKI
ncbi:MAG: HAD-IB family hydrolase [Actinomycetota bacterium]|nr:HAD-IB family hydrolase [Actinomycetota bacterium]